MKLNCNLLLLYQSDIEIVKALFCRACREYFAFGEKAFHIHRQSARHLEKRKRPYIRSSSWAVPIRMVYGYRRSIFSFSDSDSPER